MSEKSNSSSGGISFLGMLVIVFIALKLMKYIAWSWLWVLSPIWISVFLGFVVVVMVVLFDTRR